MKVEINDEVQAMTVAEVVERLETSGALMLGTTEIVKDYRLECGCDLEIDIYDRADKSERTETITESDIRADFVNADWCAWAKDEEGNDILLCFGAC